MSENMSKILAAKAVLDAYREGKPESAEEAIGDLIADLLHLARSMDLDIEALFARAKGYFWEEYVPGENCYVVKDVTPCGSPGKIGELLCTCACDGNPETEDTAVCDGCDHETWSQASTSRETVALLNRAAAALETPGDLTPEEVQHVAEDLGVAADQLQAALDGRPFINPPMPILKHRGPPCSLYEVGRVCVGDKSRDCSECPNLVHVVVKQLFQFKVNFSFEAEDLKGAYRQLREALRLVQVGWETDDQWWDENGEAHGEKELQEAILAVLDEEEENEHSCPKCGCSMQESNISIGNIDGFRGETCLDCGFTQVDPNTPICKFCNRHCPPATAHRHQEGWVGDECCWDERLRSTE